MWNMWNFIHYNDESRNVEIFKSIAILDNPDEKEKKKLEKILLDKVIDRTVEICSCNRDIVQKSIQAYIDSAYDNDFWNGYLDKKPADELADIEYITLHVDDFRASIAYHGGFIDLITASQYNDMPSKKIEVKTELGNLVAEVSPDRKFRGIYISLTPWGQDHEIILALAEVIKPAYEEKGEPVFHLRPWVSSRIDAADENGIKIDGRISDDAPMEDIAVSKEDFKHHLSH